MLQDFTNNLIWSGVENYINEQIAVGLPENKIQAMIDAIDIEKATKSIIEEITKDCIDSIQNDLYERVMAVRGETAEFLVHNERLWQSGFVASEMMYLIVTEAAESYSKIFEEMPQEEKSEIQYRYGVLRELHGRACQIFLEILCLLKSGFADGAYARWRSMYEVCVVAQFISQNDEKVAKSYYDEAFLDTREYEWAKVAPCFVGKSSINFNMIQQQCTVATEQWQRERRFSSKVLHAAPQGTFARLGNASNHRIIAVGHSDYGIAVPAVDSAASLTVVSAIFFGFLTSGDGTVYSCVISKWLDILREKYSAIEEKCFDKGEVCIE